MGCLGRTRHARQTSGGSGKMMKRELIDQITKLNVSAKPEFLAQFSEPDLRAYLRQLRDLQRTVESDNLLECMAVEV